MRDFKPLESILLKGDLTRRDMRKIESMILYDIKMEIQKTMDMYLLERLFAQINQE